MDFSSGPRANINIDDLPDDIAGLNHGDQVDDEEQAMEEIEKQLDEAMHNTTNYYAIFNLPKTVISIVDKKITLRPRALFLISLINCSAVAGCPSVNRFRAFSTRISNTNCFYPKQATCNSIIAYASSRYLIHSLQSSK